MLHSLSFSRPTMSHMLHVLVPYDKQCWMYVVASHVTSRPLQMMDHYYPSCQHVLARVVDNVVRLTLTHIDDVVLNSHVHPVVHITVVNVNY